MRLPILLIFMAACTGCEGCDGNGAFARGMLVRSEQNFEFEWPEGQTEGRVLAGTARIGYDPHRAGSAAVTIVKGDNVDLDITVVRFLPVGPLVTDDTLFQHDELVIDMYMTACVDRGDFTVTFRGGIDDPDQSTFTATRVKVPPIPPPNPEPPAGVFLWLAPLSCESTGAIPAFGQLTGRDIVIHLTGPGGTIFVDPDTGETVSEALFDPSGVWNAARFGLMTENVSAPADQRYQFYIAGNGGHTITSFNQGSWGLNALRIGTTTDIARSDGSGAGDPPPKTFTVTSPGNNIIWLTTPAGTTQPLIGYNIPAGQKVISAYYDSLTGILYVVTEQPANGRAGKIYAIDTMNPMGPAFPPGLDTGEGPVKVDYADGIVVCANQQSNTIGIYQKDSSAEGFSHVTDLPAGGPVYGVDARAHGDSVEVVWGIDGFLHFARVNTLDGTVTAESTVAVPGMPGLQYARWFVGGGALFSSPTQYGFTYNAQEAFGLDPAYAD